MKKVFYVLQFCILVLCGCGSDSEEDEELSGGQGLAPNEIVGKTLTLKKSGGSTYLVAEHLSESGVLVTSSDLVDYGKYPPSYSYSVAGDKKASYDLKVTKKVYIPYYGTYSYSTFVFDIDLNFVSSTIGTYSGTQTNGEGKKSTIAGNFTLN